MLRYSYKVELKRLELKITSLNFNLLKNPNNKRAKILLEEAKKEHAWFKKRIAEDKDPGVHIL